MATYTEIVNQLEAFTGRRGSSIYAFARLIQIQIEKQCDHMYPLIQETAKVMGYSYYTVNNYVSYVCKLLQSSTYFNMEVNYYRSGRVDILELVNLCCEYFEEAKINETV